MDCMSQMDRDMASAPMNGNPDHDFASMMIPHHQGAVDMAKWELLHGKDLVLKRLAQEIIVTQQEEIDVMHRRLASYAPHSLPKQVQRGQGSKLRSVSDGDRVYTADQTSNTISVINPATNTLLGVIQLGEEIPVALGALYRGQLLVHGLGFSPDHHTLVAVSVGSNSVSFIDTPTNKVKGVVYVGRSPHEAAFTPNGREVWVTVRGEDYVSVIDANTLKEKRRIQTANGPGMVQFRPDGRYGFVVSSFNPELDVVDTRTYKVLARVPQASPFSPNLSVSSDGTEVWFTLKDSGKTQVMSAKPPFSILATLNTGALSNHVALVETSLGKVAYVTVGSENLVKVFSRGANPKLIASIPTGDLPHGLWASADGSRIYVGLENQDAVSAIDTATNKVIATIPIGLQPQALVYVPNAVPSGNGQTNLTPLGKIGEATHIAMLAPQGQEGKATVSVNSLGAMDLVQIAAYGLKPGATYQLWLVESLTAPLGQRTLLATFRANQSGAGIAQAVGPFRAELKRDSNGGNGPEARYLIVTMSGESSPVLIEQKAETGGASTRSSTLP